MRQHFVCRRPTGIYSVEIVSDSLLNSNWRQDYRNAEKQIVRHVDTVMPCALRSVVIHIPMPSRASEIPCEVLWVGFPLRDEACVKRRYYPILYTRVSVEGSEWGGRGLAGVVHEIPCADNIVAVSISINGDALVEEVSLRYQPEFCGVRDDVLDLSFPIPSRNLCEEVPEFYDIPFLGIFTHVQPPPENLFNDTSFMLLEEFDKFALGSNAVVHEGREIGDMYLFDDVVWHEMLGIEESISWHVQQAMISCAFSTNHAYSLMPFWGIEITLQEIAIHTPNSYGETQVERRDRSLIIIFKPLDRAKWIFSRRTSVVGELPALQKVIATHVRTCHSFGEECSLVN